MARTKGMRRPLKPSHNPSHIGTHHDQAINRTWPAPQPGKDSKGKKFPPSYPATPVANQADAGSVDKSGDQG